MLTLSGKQPLTLNANEKSHQNSVDNSFPVHCCDILLLYYSSIAGTRFKISKDGIDAHRFQHINPADHDAV